MTQRERIYVRSDTLWNMRIDHPYSLAVLQGKTGWSCGQCPLGRNGETLSPGDLIGQVRHVSRIIKQILSDTGMTPSQVVKLVLYYVDQGPETFGRMIATLREEFGQRALLIPVAVPHFYYDGMLVEIDFHVSHAPSERGERGSSSDGFCIEIVDGDELAWARVLVQRDNAAAAAKAARQALDQLVGRRMLLAEQWHISEAGDGEALTQLRNVGLCGDPGFAVQAGADREGFIHGELTFAYPGHSSSEAAHGDVSLLNRVAGDFFWIAGRAEAKLGGIVPQTSAIMDAIRTELERMHLDFGAVCKATTLYVGTASADDLHDNMKVRNRYYSKPGPSSTGLPVVAFPLSTSAVTISVLGRHA
ncbi:RidA family protein [Rhodoligotrophos defluvii]|uniref:RidA family protein n=1 Tax=Rhodoligotrophos defluvii TaxID=2561934 RepID=UPI0010C97A03|nr:RidA family protein [Rhodoligotrophos defluvii]